ncbi:MAG TPA: HAMP domain-containing sensor histidine kinase [Candidatus Caenarcaniphilales bacterium]
MSTWFLPTVSEVLAFSEPTLEIPDLGSETTEAQVAHQWSAAIAAASQLLQATIQTQAQANSPQRGGGPSLPQGVVLAGPVPVFSDSALTACFPSWIFTATPFSTLGCQLPPPKEAVPAGSPNFAVPLLPGDPVGAEQFCLLLTAEFSLVMTVNSRIREQPSFCFSFAPEAVQQIFAVLRSRLLLTYPTQLELLDALFHQFMPTEPHYKTVTQFSRLLLQFLSSQPQLPNRPCETLETRSPLQSSLLLSGPKSLVPDLLQSQPHESNLPHYSQPPEVTLEALSELEPRPDVELLQAIAHEVRTPLATISTLTRLLLKRPDLPAEVIKRLEAIQRECAEQIDRFSLIFKAVELETSSARRSPVHLSSISLAQVLHQSIPRWQKQATRRSLTLQVSLPQQMPAVVSDPIMLDQVLTGLIDRFTRSLPAGSHIHMQVTLAGEQLKLQLQSQPPSGSPDQPEAKDSAMPMLKSIGQLLMLQPETGCLSLSLPVTKNLFQALGGKLTVRKQSHQGEVLTIFLPLGRESNAYSS